MATYATMVDSLNVGGGRLLPAHLVTAVTVRPTHRRRGVLRAMMTRDLRRAKDAGLALAGLTASEATIYGRFGFGAATSAAETRVDSRGGLEFTASPAGSIAVADNSKLLSVAPEIYRAHLQGTFGALGRQHGYWMRASGAWSEETSEPDKALRGVIRYNQDGIPDGYVTYKSLGWQTDPHTVKITDLVAASDEAYRELWRYLGSIDLVERLTFDVAPVADPLPWMLADRRRYSGSGTLVLTVRDPLGMANGVWQLDAHGGTGIVHPAEGGTVPAGAEAVDIDIAALGSLYLGGVSAPTLAAAGGIRGSRAALDLTDALFTAGPAPYCSTMF
ncbi:GNAT family N-acetyltransferase [Arthrobacter sp. NPDC097144]|uniref:GNAT family N-acetyltransferase n=1 Tax=Arthrobacter sp. NPDC097144 TaxID=3363946 RepID=UPI0037F9C491